ncbi:MAG: hypothetical protein KF729_02790 [Sandaracinaceae bacterium]|nr:hypothetical protein [Sandaracinaceae bacterium]
MTVSSWYVRSCLVVGATWLVGSSIVSAQAVVPATPTEAGRPRHAMLPETMETARGMAMGLGARASATSTSGLAYNPAGLSIGRHYHVESAFVYEPQNARFSSGGALIDSYSGPVNMGVSFRYVHGNGENGHGGYDGRVALGLPLGDYFAIGATGRYVSFWREGQEGANPYAEHVTFDAAVRVSPLPGFHIAALGYNLVDVGSSLAPLQVGGSISYTIDNVFTLAFDGLADLGTFRDIDGNIRPEALFGGAAELFTGEVPIRAGWMFDTGRDLHYLTAGGGWMNQEVGVDVAVRQQITGPTLDTWLLASFRYFIH